MSLVWEPHHFSDYGFDPQITHFQQYADESRKNYKRASLKPIDTIRFKLKKPISKDESRRTTAASRTKSKKKRWWKSALSYLKGKWAEKSGQKKTELSQKRRGGFISGPVYATESKSEYAMLYGGSYKMEEIPYASLREMNMCEQNSHRMSASATPLYLVT